MRRDARAPVVETLLAGFLFVLAGWTLFIKYLFPAAWSIAHGEPLTAHVYWDAWPLAHALLGWALLTQPAGTRQLALVVAVAEIVIVVASFALFLRDPEWSIWRTNWFVNKVFVLICFTLVLVAALTRGRRWRVAADARIDAGERQR